LYTVVIKQILAHFSAEGVPQRRLYVSLYEQLKAMIEEGVLPEGAAMPPTRMLSERLGFGRSTVVKAYGLLTENHLLKARQGSAYTVVRPVKRQTPALASTQAAYPDLSHLGQSFLQNAHILTAGMGEGLAFTPGLPPIDVFPVGQWQKLTNIYWRTIKSQDLNYTISSGLDALKQSIADYLRLSRRLACDPSQIIVVSGSLQSLFLLGCVLINPGDTVCLENPTFPNVLSIFKSLNANLMPVEGRGDALQLPEGPFEAGAAPKVLHLTPSNQYPLGGSMSLEARKNVLDWAERHNALIIENDYEHEINNWYNPVEALYSLDTSQRTIYLGTFNRILHPSIRLGYMVVPPFLLPAVKALQMHSHRFVPQSIQVVMADFIKTYNIYKHVRRAIQEAEVRREHFQSQFGKLFGSGLRLTEPPTPSFHLLAELDAGKDDTRLVAALEAKGVVTHALSRCYGGEAERQGLIMGYSCVNKSGAAAALARMAKVYKGGSWS